MFEGNQEDKNTRLTFPLSLLIIKLLEISTQLSDSLKHSSAALKLISAVQMVNINIYFESRSEYFGDRSE